MRILRLLSSTSLLAALLVPAPAPAGVAAEPVPGARPTVLPQLVDVRAVHRDGVDRVVFQFDEGIPAEGGRRGGRGGGPRGGGGGAGAPPPRGGPAGWSLPGGGAPGGPPRAAPPAAPPRGDGSGLPIRIAGRAVLQVGLHPTRTDRATDAPARRAFALPNVMTVVRSGVFEGWTTYGVGLARRSPVAVVRQPARDRIVVTVGAGFRTVQRRVFFLDEDRFLANREPFFVPRLRLVPVGSPATGVMDRLFAGPLDRERDRGLRLVRSRATGFADLAIAGGIARVRLRGGCSSGGSTVTIAGEVMPTLRQFDTVDWVKVLDPSARTADPTGPGDSIPDCLNP